jgi:nitrate/TMAO reductase-like tetraheme cytochrome c subunit
MEPSKKYCKIIIFFLIVSLFFTLSLIKDSLHAKEDTDQCLSCHTDKNRMKALIPKFPEPPEEEGEA